MSPHLLSRRDFLKSTAAATAAAALAPGVAAAQSRRAFDPKNIPTRRLGKTGVEIPILVIGTGSRFMAVEDEDAALEILTHALDHGLYHWDTAANYGRPGMPSEERLGRILKDRRSEVFLSTKVPDRKGEEARRTIETSLKRLNTDYIDLYQIHSVESAEDVAAFSAPDGALPVLLDYKEQGIIRHIGFSGHSSAEGMKRAAETDGFETMLIALNHYQQGNQPMEEQAVPAALERGLGVLAMKVIRPRETVTSLPASDLIRYALSLEGITAAVIGTDSLDVLTANIAVAEAFEPLSEPEMQRVRLSMAPFYRSRSLPWMQPSYHDAFLA